MVSFNSLSSGSMKQIPRIFEHYRVEVFHVTTFASPSAGHFFPISSSAVVKSPKFSARSAAPPMRLLHGVLVILVL